MENKKWFALLFVEVYLWMNIFWCIKIRHSTNGNPSYKKTLSMFFPPTSINVYFGHVIQTDDRLEFHKMGEVEEIAHNVRWTASRTWNVLGTPANCLHSHQGSDSTRWCHSIKTVSIFLNWMIILYAKYIPLLI